MAGDFFNENLLCVFNEKNVLLYMGMIIILDIVMGHEVMEHNYIVVHEKIKVKSVPAENDESIVEQVNDMELEQE